MSNRNVQAPTGSDPLVEYVPLPVPFVPTVIDVVLMTEPAGFVTVSVTRPAGHPLSCSVNVVPRVPDVDGRTVTFGPGTGVGRTVGAGVGGGGAIVGTGVTGVTVFVGVGLGSSTRTGVFVGGAGVGGATVALGALVVAGAVVAVATAAGTGAWVPAAGALGSTAVLTSSPVASATSQPAIATHDRSASAIERTCSHAVPRWAVTGPSSGGGPVSTSPDRGSCSRS